MGSLWLFSVLHFAIFTINYSSAQKQDYKRVCYYTNWSQYRTGLGKYTPQNVDPFVCTHIVYAFAKTSGNRIEAAEWNDESTEWSKGMYAKINDLKKKNPKLKTLLAIGGWTEGNAPISTMASTNESRDEFVSTTIQYLRTRGFDGLDLDWEYPGSRGGPPEDKENLIHLLKKLRTEFNREARETGREALLLAIAVPVGEERISSGYKIPEVDRYVDFINLMAYDFHGAWEAQTGHHSPLHRGKAERWYAAQLNVQWAAGYWRRNGASKDKLLIGIAMYGRGFKLQYPSINGIGAQALVGSNGNSMGPFTKSKGLLSFYEICDRLNGNGEEVWDEERRVPYMYDGSDWVGYENVRSVIEKTKWVMDHGYAGIMIWALDQDDFTGHFCKAGKYPLLSAINNTLNEYTPSTEGMASQHDILQATEDYGGITNRIVDSTSLSLTGLTLRHSQTPNAIIHTTTIATTSTTAAAIKTTANVVTSTIVPSTTSTTEPSTHTTEPSTTTTTEPSTTTTSEPSTTTTTTEPATTTIEPSTTTGLPKTTSFTDLTIAAEDEVNATAPSIGNISTTEAMESETQNNSVPIEKTSPAIAAFDIFSDNITSDLHLTQNVSSDIENITVDSITMDESNITNNTTISNIALIENSTESPIKESTTARIMRSRSQIMSIVAPSDIYSSTDIVHRGRTLLQVDLNRNEQSSNNGDGQNSGFTSVLNSLFSVLSEFGGFARGSRSSSNRRANNADTAGQGTVESQRPRNVESQLSRNVDPARQRNAGIQRQRNGDTQPVRNREVPVRRNDADFQRVRNGLRASNGDILRQDNVDQSRQRMLPRTRVADSARPVQRNGDPTLRRNGEAFRQRNAEPSRQRNEILRRNNDLMRQRNGNNDILRQRSENPESFRQRNVNGDLVRQRNGDLSQQQQRNTFRNGDLIQQRNAPNLNSRDAEPRRQRTMETTRRMQQRTPSLTPNRRSPQLGGMNTVSPQFDPFQNVEMATIPQNLGPRSTRRGESNSIPSVDFLETLVQGSSARNINPTVINGRGIETNRIPNRNRNPISQGVPDISTLTDMFFAQDPQNQLLQQEAVQTSISEAMLSPNFLNRANGLGRLQRMITPEPIQSSNIFDNRNISSNMQASQMRETLFSEIRNRQPSLNTNSIDTIDLAFLESQVEEGFARDRAQQIEQSMLRPGMLVNEPRQGILNGVLPAAAGGFQGLIGQGPSQQASIGRVSMIPSPNQFQQTSMQLPQTNRNTSMAVIPFNNLDRTLQRIVATGPGFRLRNQTTSTRSVLQNPTEQGFFLQNGQRTPRAGNPLNPTLVRPGPSQENNRNILTSQPGLPGPLQLARLQDSLRPNRNMLGPLGPIQGNRNTQPMNNFLTPSVRGTPRIGTPLLQTANTNNQLPLNSLFSPMNQISPRVSTIGSPGTPHRTPPPFSSTAIQTPDEVIQGRNVIGSKSVFSQRSNSTVNIDGSMLKSEPVIPKSEILWKWDV